VYLLIKNHRIMIGGNDITCLSWHAGSIVKYK